MSQNDFKGLIHSMSTAITTGIILSVIAIFLYSYSSHPYVSDKILRQQEEDFQLFNEDNNEEDPVFSSHISNAVIYSSDNGFEIAERKEGAPATESKRKITAKSYSVINISDNQTILEKNQEKLLPIASITKLVTAVIARKLLDQNQYIAITPQMASTYGNEARFRIGEKMTAEELLYPLLMVSSNDSAEALAISYYGGRKAFIREMNSWVNSIGAYRTYFRDPSGLSAYNLSTSQDISIIVKWILNNDPEIFDITMNKTKSLRTHTWTNPKHFLNLSVYAGGKNGYTTEANRTGVSLFKIGKSEKLFLVVLLGSSMRDNDTLDLLDEAVM